MSATTEVLPDKVLAQVDAGVIAAVADGDFVAGSYASGDLAPDSAGFRDTLVLLRRSGGGWRRESLPISNSVTAPPEVLRLAADGRSVYVIERLAPRTPGASRIAELAPGRRLFAVALPAGAPAKLADAVELDDFPEALDISPDGRTIAVVSNGSGGSWLHLVPCAGGRFGSVQKFDLAEIAGAGRAPRASNVAWHPSGRILAINFHTENRILFVVLEESGGHFSPRPWGAAVEVGRDPFVGRFAPDGRHYITADWGRNFDAVDLAGRLPESASQLTVVRLGRAGAVAPAHRVVHRTRSDISSEGLAISRNGRFVATVNMRGTVFPAGSPRFQRHASVSLFRFDAADGSLKKIVDRPFTAVLPEGGAFDASGHYFLASVFEYRDLHGGGIEVFRVSEQGLEPLGRIPMPHGVHHLDMAP
ncbi:lactonase family protein [Microbulbifer taiwanensis]|uniref:Lactonase family protein n=1 Tax=Microbulbifer taiwanensis TaxID=986746 RepID=A0ABW1YMA8_9GAMM|nr:hypothetical protein [Microbulbifer taiwanensis]